MRVTILILNTFIETLKTWKSSCHSLDSQAEGCVTNSNDSHNRNVMYLGNSVYKFTMVLHLCLIQELFCQWNYNHDLVLICGVFQKRNTNFYKLSSWEPFIHHIHDFISLINTESNGRLINKIIQVYQGISFLKFNLK